jgi:hypothetical protein
VGDEHSSRLRSDPLTIGVGQSEFTLTSSEVNALISGMEAWRHSLKRQLEQIARDKPQAIEAATRRIGRLERLEDVLVGTSSRLSDPPLELDADQATLVEETLGELTGYQRGELTGGLRELKLALYRR